MYRPRKLPLEHYLCLLPARGAYNQGCTTGQLSGPCSDMASVSTGSLSVCPCPEVADKPTRTQKLRQSLNLRWLQKPGAHFRETTLVTSIYRDNASDQYITRRLIVQRRIGLVAALTDMSELLPLIGVCPLPVRPARASPPLASSELGSDAHCSVRAMTGNNSRNHVFSDVERFRTRKMIV